MIVSVFVRRLKEGRTFADFLAEWEADVGFGVRTRVLNAQSVDDQREILSVGFIDMTTEELHDWLSTGSASEAARHARIETVIESTELRSMYELRTEHDFTDAPRAIDIGSAASLLHALVS